MDKNYVFEIDGSIIDDVDSDVLNKTGSIDEIHNLLLVVGFFSPYSARFWRIYDEDENQDIITLFLESLRPVKIIGYPKVIKKLTEEEKKKSMKRFVKETIELRMLHVENAENDPRIIEYFNCIWEMMKI